MYIQHNYRTQIVKKAFLIILAGVLMISSLSGCGRPFPAAVIGSELLALGSDNPAYDTSGSESSPSPSPSGTPSDTGTGKDKSSDSDPSDNTLLSLDEINKELAQYGSMTIAGMKPEDYDAVQSIEWTVLNTSGKPKSLSINLSNLMDYKAYEKYILNLDKYSGVEVDVIGKSELGRNMYMVKVALGGEENKPIIMLTGSVHAREFAGCEYLTKFLNDTIKKAQTSPSVRNLLKKVVIVAVPLVNPDGRQMIIDGGNKNRKSNSNGVDLNRAMPSVNAGQLSNGVQLLDNFSTVPGLDFFAGYNLGTESESQAMMKFYDYYTPTAALYIDLHQQGGLTRYNKGFVTAASDTLSYNFAKKINSMLEKGYGPKLETKDYGLNGDGGTLTDYVRSIAEGFKYSYSYGRMVLDENGTETPLIVFKDLDNVKQFYNPVNAKLRVNTIEIGRDASYLGPGARARLKRKHEYVKYGWDNFLTGIIKNVLAF